jgi:ribosomal protein S8
MFSIYHIPTFVHKDGSIGKIGCTHQEPKSRVNRQGYSDFEVLEVHEDIDIASIREQELQKEYGYPVDKVLFKDSYYRLLKVTKKQKSKGAKKVGDNNVKNGHMQRISKLPKNMSSTYKKVLQYDKNGNFIKEWNSLSHAAESMYIHHSNLIACCKGRQKTSKGFIWKYKD